MPTSPALLGIDQPPLMPAHVARVNVITDPVTGEQRGLPSKPAMDWEEFQHNFNRSALASLDTRITTVETNYTTADATISASVVTEQIARTSADAALASSITTVTANYTAADAAITASVTSEATARSSADGALAADITTFTASYNDISASGQIYFAAKAGPTGSTAAYGLYLTAGAAFAGFEVVALSAGGSAINMTADKLMFSDSGTATAVFDYGVSTPGVFTFNVPVEINNVDIGANAVSNTVVNTGSVASGGDLVTASLTVRAGARVAVEIKVTETSGSIYLASFSTSFTSRGFAVTRDGGTAVGTMWSMDSVITATFSVARATPSTRPSRRRPKCS
jgi:hypothetical protein